MVVLLPQIILANTPARSRLFSSAPNGVEQDSAGPRGICEGLLSSACVLEYRARLWALPPDLYRPLARTGSSERIWAAIDENGMQSKSTGRDHAADAANGTNDDGGDALLLFDGNLSTPVVCPQASPPPPCNRFLAPTARLCEEAGAGGCLGMEVRSSNAAIGSSSAIGSSAAIGSPRASVHLKLAAAAACVCPSRGLSWQLLRTRRAATA
jgi:hypothetical protein